MLEIVEKMYLKYVRIVIELRNLKKYCVLLTLKLKKVIVLILQRLELMFVFPVQSFWHHYFMDNLQSNKHKLTNTQYGPKSK